MADGIWDNGGAPTGGPRLFPDALPDGVGARRRPSAGELALPDWFAPLLTRLHRSRAEDFTRLPTPDEGGRDSAVLVLLGEEPDGGGPDILVLQRAATLRNHAGQPAFPGGVADPGDADPAATALREADEEVGLDPSSVTLLAELPTLWIPASDFLVTPVLAWWHRPHPVAPRDPGEVAHVARLPVAELTDPANRLRLRHPSGWIGPAFEVRGMLVWGFTAGVLSTLLDMAGWTRPWPQDRIADLPPTTPPPAATADADEQP
ncbi:coenzyme A pyrophosphatase [Asanoa ishikariensis]|uniref:NUDIX domain-containing protein n=1 Tax=Asanoa ishikariensis TaxID=137265 RepID=A0A1H3UVH6_9ACTN|nr:coenzyme A pyrophosphatase [Asanoa ishikariensis]SDZ66423.1 NUDIX domain-containing protein [Asanoa ishikariensis]